MDDQRTIEHLYRIVATIFKEDVTSLTLDSGAATIPRWDSFGQLRLLMEVERVFGLRFSMAEIGQPRTIRDLHSLISSRG